jgi:hypothetical protein
MLQRIGAPRQGVCALAYSALSPAQLARWCINLPANVR